LERFSFSPPEKKLSVPTTNLVGREDACMGVIYRKKWDPLGSFIKISSLKRTFVVVGFRV
jgi:hypothetical protein